MTTSPETSQSIGPLIEPPTVALDPELRHLEPILYGDIFDYPLTLEEVWRYCPLPLSREQVAERLENYQRLVQCSDGFYHLTGREELVAMRHSRQETSRVIWKQALRVAGLICNVPFIRGMAITGSLATDNAGEDGDPDFLVITANNRVWTVFFFLGTIQKMTSTHTLCPNFYISENNLTVTPCDYYNAREVTQAIPLLGDQLFQRFQETNRWVSSYLPNCAESVAPATRTIPRHGLLRLAGRLFEGITSGWLGDRMEQLLRRRLYNRLPGHYRTFGGEAPEEVLDAARQGSELRFHGLHHRTMIQQAIDQRLDLLRLRLDSPQRLTG